MDTKSILRFLIRESLILEDETAIDAQRQGTLSQGDLEGSALARSYYDHPWQKLIVYKQPGRLWEVIPRLDRGQLVGFAFYQLRMQRQPDPIITKSKRDIIRLEAEFELEHGINASHVTVLS